jgi:hypothetical protein
MSADEWRVEVILEQEGHGLRLGKRLQTLDLDDEARERLGDRVVVTRDGPHMFLYAASEPAAREAERVARELAASEEGIEAEVTVTRWHPAEEAWKDASEPMPETEEERSAEVAHREEAERASGEHEWEIRVDLPSHRAAVDVAERLTADGLEVQRRWRHLLVAALTEEDAAEIGERIRAEAPEGTTLQLEPAQGYTHPAFVFMGSHAPKVTRDLGL